MPKTVLTKKDKQLFNEALVWAIAELGLKDWEVHVIVRPCKNRGEITANIPNKIANIILSSTASHSGPDDIVDTAIHEALELKLWTLLDYVGNARVPRDMVDTERHAVIHSLAVPLKRLIAFDRALMSKRKKITQKSENA